MLTAKELLIQAKKLIDTPEKWIQGKAACNRYGVPVFFFSPEAVRFCSIGAMARTVSNFCLHNNEEGLVLSRAEEQLRVSMKTSILIFNDRHTHAEVMEAWDNAIATL